MQASRYLIKEIFMTKIKTEKINDELRIPIYIKVINFVPCLGLLSKIRNEEFLITQSLPGKISLTQKQIMRIHTPATHT